MINFKKKLQNMKNPAEAIKNKAESSFKAVKEGSEDLNKKIQDSSEAINKNLKKPMPYNALVLFVPIVLILLTFIPMAPWAVQILGFAIFCCVGYVGFFEYHRTKRRDGIFYTALALTVLFNPLIPFFIPGKLINIITIAAIGYIYYSTQLSKDKDSTSNHSHPHKK